MSGINLDPIEECLEARNLNQLIERWLASKDVAPTTLLAYRDKIHFFTVWWDKVGPTVEWRLTKSLLQEFELYLRGVIARYSDKPLTYSTRKAVIRDLRIMFKWAAKTDRTTRNYGEWVPWPTGETPQRKAVTVEQLGRLMLAAADSPTPLRDQALLAFFIGTGCRLCEVVKLQVEDLQIRADGSGTATVTGKRTKANQSGVRTIAFDAATGHYLIRYMEAATILSGRLWVSEKKTFHLRGSSIYAVVQRCVTRAGLVGHIRGCHDLRRAFATILGRMHPTSPAWADMIRRQLGHKHYSMTAHYTLVDADDIREWIQTPLGISSPQTNHQKDE